MTADSPDLLQTLPPELRLEIYQHVLTSEYWLRRFEKKDPMPATELFAALLEVCTYIREEAREVLYSTNAFKLTFKQMCEFPQPEDLCRTKNILLEPHRESTDTFSLALAFEDEMDAAARKAKTKIAMQMVTIPASKASIDYLRSEGHLTDVNVGIWTATIGRPQPFDIQIVCLPLQEMWSYITSQPSTDSGYEVLVKYETTHDRPDQWFRVEATIGALALDAHRGVGLCRSEWYIRRWRWLYHGRVMRIHDKIVTGAGLQGPARLIDVDHSCSPQVLEWANDVLMEALEMIYS
ncbi:hypothetical protein LTR27_000245 [Elasticomyces elasticus]|nr:hypothetical protein LTR27_000245 [Elasticomyces elasticus]